MHGVGNQMPELDQQQDYKLVSARQEEGKTTIRFQRSLTTCDVHDLEITVISIEKMLTDLSLN